MAFDYELKNKAVILPVKAVPGSSKSRFAGIWDHKLKIAIAAPPEKGKANKELIRFLAKTLKISKSDIQIIAGEHDTHKKVQLAYSDPAEIIDKLSLLIST